MSLILASQSPRRRQLLTLTGLDFRVVPAELDETPIQGESPREYVARLAREKVRWVREHQVGDLIIAADTTVVYENQILGKPTSPADAEKMLWQLRGRIHQVYTGIALLNNGNLVQEVCGSDVPMRKYSEVEMHAYIETGDPLDKAGAYAIQHTHFHPVENFRGCFANVMGLPLCHLTRALRKFGSNPKTEVPVACQENIHYRCPVFDKILREEI